MSNTLPSLRRVLLADAATCVGAGLLMTLGAGALAPALCLPAGLLLYAGGSLFPIAAFMIYVGLRATDSTLLTGAVVAGNAAWVLGSLLVMAGVAGVPSALGIGFVAAQALAVSVLAALELAGVLALRASGPTARPA